MRQPRESAIDTIRKAQEVTAESFDQRVRAIEEKFPDADESRKYADANELFSGVAALAAER